jgi:signal transduction histidine kinase
VSAAGDARILAPADQDSLLRRLLESALALAAVLVTAGGAVALLAPSLGSTGVASPGQAGPLSALLVLLAAASLVVAGATAWITRPERGLALIAFCASATWMAGELTGSASVAREARTLGQLIGPFFVPLIVHLPVLALQAGSPSRRTTIGLGTLYAVTAVAAVGRSMSYDPFFDIHCAPVCARGDNLLAVRPDMRAADAFAALGAVTAIVAGFVAAAWAMWRLARERRGRRGSAALVLVPTTLAGVALAWSAAARLAMVPDRPEQPGMLVPMGVLAAGTALLGGGVTLKLLLQVRRRASLQLLVEALTAAEGSPSLRATLAATLGDDLLRVAYPLEDGGLIDETGEPVEVLGTEDGRAVATIKRGAHVVALVEHDGDLDPVLLDREIGAAARLAVDNERLEATIRARLRELQASRARIVEAGDLARGRLERDLHDGAQQRLLAVSFELRLALSALGQDGREGVARASVARASVAQAIEELDRAIDELRELAHGIHPVVLREDGLAGALASLADSAAVPIVVQGDMADRCTAPAELAAYLALVEAVRQAEAEGVDRVDVAMERSVAGFSVAVDHVDPDRGRWQRIEDRVGAAGGRLDLATAPDGRTTLTVALPCA